MPTTRRGAVVEAVAPVRPLALVLVVHYTDHALTHVTDRDPRQQVTDRPVPFSTPGGDLVPDQLPPGRVLDHRRPPTLGFDVAVVDAFTDHRRSGHQSCDDLVSPAFRDVGGAVTVCAFLPCHRPAR